VSAVGSTSAFAEPAFVGEARTQVERELLGSVQNDDAFLTEVTSHLIVAGGKRVRPLFAVAAAGTATAGSDAPVQVSEAAAPSSSSTSARCTTTT
jgi:geranylgeranyl pyrophosphate synthase